MKYPASNMIGGSRKRKNSSELRCAAPVCPSVKSAINPIGTPSKIKTQDSGMVDESQ